MRMNADQTPYYFSDKLKKKLTLIRTYAVTFVEAPSGFGKTTAMREFLKKYRPEDSREYWHTCLGETSAMDWIGIYDLFENIDYITAFNLKKLGMPTTETIMYVPSLIKDLKCTGETYLVIDNYQLSGCDVVYEFMNILSMHNNPYLHIIFISQTLGMKPMITFHNNHIHKIETADFLFDRKSIASLFRQEKIRLTEEEVNTVFESTEGWVSALRLQIINYKKNGILKNCAGIHRLVENAIWNRLTQQEKEFLVSVSVMDEFNVKRAADVIGEESLPENILRMLKSNDFIRFFPDNQAFSIHNILRDYLRNQFYLHQTEEFKKRVFYTIGQSYVSDLKLFTATKYFLSIRDFDAILSMPFDNMYLAGRREKDLMDFVLTMLRECPESTFARYPFVMLMFAYILLMNRHCSNLQQVCRMIESSIEQNHAGLNEAGLQQLKGEYLLLQSVSEFNNIEKMSEKAAEALTILDYPSRIVSIDLPWTFGSTSILCLYWRESGKLDKTLQNLEEFLPSYIRLTGGHGSGAESAAWAEAMLMRGEDDKAEILCHRALYAARSKQQTGICLCAERTLARIAILRGDIDGYVTAIANIQSYARENSNIYILRMTEICFFDIGLSLNTPEMVAKWFCNMDNIQRKVPGPAIPYVQILYSKFLIKEKRYNEFYGISEIFMNTAKEMNYLLPQIYYFIFLACMKNDQGQTMEAKEDFVKALVLALPDRIFLPFVQSDILCDLYPEVMKSCGEEYGKEIAALMKFFKRYQKGVRIIKNATLQPKSPLTPREREVALLAKSRLSTKEIADKLFISQATVRTILYNIYGKLDIHSKAELSVREF